jgi:hypothetical protein
MNERIAEIQSVAHRCKWTLWQFGVTPPQFQPLTLD